MSGDGERSARELHALRLVTIALVAAWFPVCSLCCWPLAGDVRQLDLPNVAGERWCSPCAERVANHGR